MINPPDLPKTKEARIEIVRQALADGSWDRVSSVPILARHWGLSVQTIKGYRTEAGKLVIYSDVPPTVALRVQAIIALIEDFRWDESTPQWLSERWGLGVASIKNYYREAERHFTADRDTARRDISMGCRRVFLDAMESGNAKDMHFVGNLWAKVAGLMEPIEVHHTIDAGERTHANARAAMQDLFGSVGPSELPGHAPQLPHPEVPDAEFTETEAHQTIPSPPPQEDEAEETDPVLPLDYSITDHTPPPEVEEADEFAELFS